MRIAFFPALFLITGVTNAAVPVDGLYSSLFGGYAYVPANINTAGITNTGYKSGYDIGGSIGFKGTPMRYEGQLTYIDAGLKKFTLNNVERSGVSGNSDAFLAMANVYYDFNTATPTVQPFLGAGIGYARVHAKLNSTGPFGATQYSGSSNVFTYQATTGLTYNLTPNYAINAGYRYIATKHVRSLGKSFQANLANLGVVYRFDRAGATK